MKKNHLLFILFFAFNLNFKAQVNLSVYAEISIVTVDAGDDLYEAFGHSALRIKDPVLNLDLIYNYGIFDFNAPNFYSNFTKGKLEYSLARYDFKYFLGGYQREKRWVKQQVLNLTQQQKQAYFGFLENNAAPQNAAYLYDPYYNNCATKLRDITKSILGDKVTFSDKNIEKELSLRQLMNRRIHWNSWGNFGINLALGSKLDKKTDYLQYMYLPDYIYLVFKNSTVFINNQPESLIKREDLLLDFENSEIKISVFNPLLIFGMLSIIGLFITYKDFKKKTISNWFDITLFLTTGIIGVLIVFLWFFTNHSTTPNNFNFLWAFAPNLIVGLLLLKKNPTKWISSYAKFLVFLLICIPILWISQVQLFPIATTPILILLLARYLLLSIKSI